MSPYQPSPSAHPFFLKVEGGERFCLFHPARTDRASLGALLYVHSFGDEMNKARRISSLQAREFAAIGVHVLQIDLLGCGDSSGELRDATWDAWKRDVTDGARWLQDRGCKNIGLWGLRLGALLALDVARTCERQFDRVILWQPVISGDMFLTQFLRTQLATDMLAGDEGRQGGTGSLRMSLAAGEIVEVGGYELAPALAMTIDSKKTQEMVIRGCPVHWFEIVPQEGRQVPLASGRVAHAWEKAGVDLALSTVAGQAFWACQEIAECPALLSATSQIFTETTP